MNDPLYFENDLVGKKLINNSKIEGYGESFTPDGAYFTTFEKIKQSYDNLNDGLSILTCDCPVNMDDSISELKYLTYSTNNKDGQEDPEFLFITAYNYYFVGLTTEISLLEEEFKYDDDDFGYYKNALEYANNFIALKGITENIGFIKARILIGMKKYEEAFELLNKICKKYDSQKCEFRLARLKQTHLNLNPTINYKKTFQISPLSICLSKELKSYYSLKLGLKLIISVPNNNNNPLINAFNETDNLFDFLTILIPCFRQFENDLDAKLTFYQYEEAMNAFLSRVCDTNTRWLE